MPPHVLVDFVVLPPGHGRSVTDFWVWDAHEAHLRCPDIVSGDIGGCSARRALKPKFYQPTQTMDTTGIHPFRENSHSRAGNRTRDLMISSRRLWTLDHEAGYTQKFNITLRTELKQTSFEEMFRERWQKGLQNYRKKRIRRIEWSLKTGFWDRYRHYTSQSAKTKEEKRVTYLLWHNTSRS